MLRVNPSNRFLKDLKKAAKRGKSIDKTQKIVDSIQSRVPLEKKYKDHALTGNWIGHRECHIEPDWLLIYRIDRPSNTLVLVRTGTHADLFD